MMRTWSGFSFSWARLCCTNNAEKKASATFVFVKVAREAAGMALVDGDNGMGHVVMSFAAKTAIEKARTAGAAWVGVNRSNHAGPASLYAAMPLAHDMIGLYLAVGNANHMAPWGGIDLLLSTNPIAVAAPGNEAPIVLDMATTVAAYGKVKTAVQRGETLPEGWMIDHQGKPLTDPRSAPSSASRSRSPCARAWTSSPGN